MIEKSTDCLYAVKGRSECVHWLALAIPFLLSVHCSAVFYSLILSNVKGSCIALSVARAAALTVIILRPFARMDKHTARAIVVVVAFILR